MASFPPAPHYVIAAGRLLGRAVHALGTMGGPLWGWARRALVWSSHHTGIPAILLAAVVIVVLYRLAKRSARFVAQVSLVLVVLAVLTKLGILRF